MKKRSRPVAPRSRHQAAGGMPTLEWRRHHSDAVVENRDIKGVRGVRAVSQSGNAFDRYRRRGELAPGDKKENMRRHMAGERLRGDWERAGLDTRARQSFERRDGSVEEFSAARVDAHNRVREAMVVLGPTRAVVLSAAVYGDRVGRAKMEMLRAGLDVLADMYFGRK